MKKLFSFLTASLIVLCGCSMNKNTPIVALSDTSEVVTQADSELENYTIDDVIVLQDFLLGKSKTTNGKNFDLCKDNRLDVFDLCMLKSEVAKNIEIPQNTESNILVTYFSCTNNTEGIAQYIIDYLDADSYVIEPEIPYTEDDLKYYTDCRADREQNDPAARPAIANSIDISDYDVIFVGYPIWHGQAPKIMYTFMENYDFSGKTIIPFCTSGSSPIGTSATNLATSAPDAEWLEGKRFSGSSKEDEVIKWVDSLELSKKSEENIMYITIGDTRLSATLVDNSSTQALKEKLKEAPITIDMNDYANFEKVGELGFTLPKNDEQITTEAGDLILYLGSRFVIYYDTNSWNFTRLGKINNITQDELKEILGGGDITVTLSLE